MFKPVSQSRKFQPGTWIVFAALLLTFSAWIMQLYSLLDWEGAIEIGLQNDSFHGNEVERSLAGVEKGVALADMCWPLPLTIIAIIGLIRRKQFGIWAAIMSFSISIYFPLVFTFQRWDTQRETALFAIILFAIPALVGTVALLLNLQTLKLKP